MTHAECLAFAVVGGAAARFLDVPEARGMFEQQIASLRESLCNIPGTSTAQEWAYLKGRVDEAAMALSRMESFVELGQEAERRIAESDFTTDEGPQNRLL